MPELPEVETVCTGLNAMLAGRKVSDVILNRSDMRVPFPTDLQAILIDSTIESVARRAKYILFHLDNGHSVIGHLGMSGTMRVVDADAYEPRKHDHILWDLDNHKRFAFHDPRRFGFLLTTERAKLQEHRSFVHLGPEPLSDDFDAEYLKNALSKRSMAVKTALMDQKLVVGVGNIYASEACFRAQVNPFAPTNSMINQSAKLVQAIKNVLCEAIDSGGSTLRDFLRADGEGGYFQHAFAVYGREGKPCVRCDNTVSKQVQSGRSTFFCYKCQNVK